MGYISFDVDNIQEYVFSSYRPVDIHGASELVKLLEQNKQDKFWEDFKKKYPELPDFEIIYSAGGSGILKLPDDIPNEMGEKLAQSLEDFYHKETFGTLTAVYLPAEELNRETFRILHAKIRERKATKLMESELKVIFDSDPRKMCDACGVLPYEIDDQVTNEKLCPVCNHKRKVGRKSKKNRAKSLEDIAGVTSKQDTGDKDKRIALIYADLKGMGQKLEEWAQKGELKKQSDDLWNSIHELVEKIVSELQLEYKYIDPVVGGDDLILILPEESVLEAIKIILEENKEFQEDYKTAFSVAFITAYYKFPIYLLFRYTKKLLEEAKELAYKKKVDSAVNFMNITSGTVEIPESISEKTYELLPTRKPYLQDEFEELLGEVDEIIENEVPTTFLYNLYEIIINADNHEERILNIQYQLAKRKEILPARWKNAIYTEDEIQSIFVPEYGEGYSNRLADILELYKMRGGKK